MCFGRPQGPSPGDTHGQGTIPQDLTSLPPVSLYDDGGIRMGLAERRLAKNAARLLQGSLLDDEVIVARELLKDEDGPLPAGLQGKQRLVDAILTDRRLTLLHNDRKQLIASTPLTSIAYVAGRSSELTSPMLEVTLMGGSGGSPWLFSFPMNRRDDFAVELQRSLLRLPRSEFTTEFKGQKVKAVYNPWRKDQMAWWDWSSDAPMDQSDSKAIWSMLEELGAKIQANNGVSVSEVNATEAFDERNWDAEIRGLLSFNSENPHSLTWAAGDAVDGSGRAVPTIWALTETNLYNCKFESMRSALDLPRVPTVLKIPLRTLADWEQRSPEPSGSVLTRLLVLSERQLTADSLKETMKQWPDDVKIALVGLRKTPRQEEFQTALESSIAKSGAFEPGSSDYHPLRVND